MFPYSAIATSPAPIWWPSKLPGETIDQTFDTATLTRSIPAGQIMALEAQIAPSGSGELAAAALTLVGSILTLVETSGYPSRIYSILFSATLIDGEVIQWIINQGVSPIPPPDPIQPAPDPGFGPPIVWDFTPSFNFSDPRNSAYLTIAAGF